MERKINLNVFIKQGEKSTRDFKEVMLANSTEEKEKAIRTVLEMDLGYIYKSILIDFIINKPRAFRKNLIKKLEYQQTKIKVYELNTDKGSIAAEQSDCK